MSESAQRIDELFAQVKLLEGNIKVMKHIIATLRAELEALEPLRETAQAVVDRWDTPKWKDAPATAQYIDALRDALPPQR